jgi:1,4-dihydroxy-2-naphthoyl-CoA hydrolase
MDMLALMQRFDVPLTRWLGIRFLSATPERVTAEMVVREDLGNEAAVLHGGALMAFADTLGACATGLNLPEDVGTTTVESKTNFLAPAPVGTKVIGECVPLHRGRRTMVWQTRVTAEDGRLLAVVTQTQLVLERPRAAPLQLASTLTGKPAAEQKAMLAAIERDCAMIYRQLAAAEPDPSARDMLLSAAARHEEQADRLQP